jgi:hypothetical protein
MRLGISIRTPNIPVPSKAWAKFLVDEEVKVFVKIKCEDGSDIEQGMAEEDRTRLESMSSMGISPIVTIMVDRQNLPRLRNLVRETNRLNKGMGIEIQPMDPLKAWSDEDRERFPDPEDYSRALLDLYLQEEVPLESISPLNELRSRLSSNSLPYPCAIAFQCTAAVNSKAPILVGIQNC